MGNGPQIDQQAVVPLFTILRDNLMSVFGDASS